LPQDPSQLSQIRALDDIDYVVAADILTYSYQAISFTVSVYDVANGSLAAFTVYEEKNRGSLPRFIDGYRPRKQMEKAINTILIQLDRSGRKAKRTAPEDTEIQEESEST
jgi:hypothetical protein